MISSIKPFISLFKGCTVIPTTVLFCLFSSVSGPTAAGDGREGRASGGWYSTGLPSTRGPGECGVWRRAPYAPLEFIGRLRTKYLSSKEQAWCEFRTHTELTPIKSCSKTPKELNLMGIPLVLRYPSAWLGIHRWLLLAAQDGRAYAHFLSVCRAHYVLALVTVLSLLIAFLGLALVCCSPFQLES